MFLYDMDSYHVVCRKSPCDQDENIINMFIISIIIDIIIITINKIIIIIIIIIIMVILGA